jgi:hypothetical protein
MHVSRSTQFSYVRAMISTVSRGSFGGASQPPSQIVAHAYWTWRVTLASPIEHLKLTALTESRSIGSFHFVCAG